MTGDGLLALGAWQLSQRIARREARAEDLVRACLARIGEREADLQAFVVMDGDAALAQARTLDAGPVRGPLHATADWDMARLLP